MRHPPSLSHPVYATRVLCEVANERGVPTADVLAGTAIDPADLTKPDAMVSALDEIGAVRRLLARLPCSPRSPTSPPSSTFMRGRCAAASPRRARPSGTC